MNRFGRWEKQEWYHSQVLVFKWVYMTLCRSPYIHRRGLLVQFVVRLTTAHTSVQYPQCLSHMKVTCHASPAITLVTVLTQSLYCDCVL